MCARVSEIMSRDVVTAAHTTSLEAVANQQLQHGVGSVIITNDGAPYGIVTETDIVHAAYRSGKPLEQIPTRRVASHPLQTIDPDRPVRLAIKRMQDEGIKKIVAVDSLEVVGIMTTQDLIDHFGALTSDLKDITRDRRERRKFVRK
ncbi:CBS domain-containing protein [Natronolimnobius sp. AArcel1]|uniref:CBS domain-containing protein n=1 Tax=Natronolimnobius sp. AArcel1 TaxID=1679093 RepID=UPI0013EA30B9|nr:CBS domain-containing protein [Natronolimnobius sp. AArcel1]NGM70699.1 CBS domain-containing protein [Natronolimnobius sp. AArcel1]